MDLFFADYYIFLCFTLLSLQKGDLQPLLDFFLPPIYLFSILQTLHLRKWRHLKDMGLVVQMLWMQLLIWLS